MRKSSIVSQVMRQKVSLKEEGCRFFTPEFQSNHITSVVNKHVPLWQMSSGLMVGASMNLVQHLL